MNKGGRQTEGLLYALGAYGWWGLVPPIYFSAINQIPSWEILAHRIVWSLPLLAGLVHVFRRWPEFLSCLRNKAILRALLLSTLLIAINWFVYIFGVVSHQIIQTSLGYFMNPLVNVLLGMLVFQERLHGLQWMALALAAVGVVSLTLYAGQLPWIALTLAFSFGFYGLIRKTLSADGLVALSVETLLLVPPSVGYLIWLQMSGAGNFGAHNTGTDLLLVLGGLITVVPLLCFGQAARLLSLSTLGFIQYLSPTGQFLVAVLWFHEPLDAVKLVSFCFIWLGLVIFTVDSLLRYRQNKIDQQEANIPIES